MGEHYWASVTFGPVGSPLSDLLEAAGRGVVDADDVDKALADSGLDADVVTAVLHAAAGHNEWDVLGKDPATGGLVFFLGREECTYGLSELLDDGLGAGLRTLGIPYYAHDDGKYDIPALYETWAPGMTRAFRTYASGDGDPYVTEAAFRHILGVHAGDNAAVVAGVRSALGMDLVPDPHPTSAALGRIRAAEPG